MAQLVYYVATTIDGYIAGPGGETEHYPLEPDMMAALNERFPESVPTAFREQAGLTDTPNRRFGTVVMGRGTYAPAYDIGVTSPYAHLRQIVFSRSLPREGLPVEVVAGDPVALVAELKKTEARDIWLCGGSELAGALYDEIDELIIKRYAIVSGAGKPLFGGGPFRPAAFHPTDRETFPSGGDITTYVRA